MHLALHGRESPKPAVPTLAAFEDRFIKEHCEANEHKPSGIAAKRSAFRAHLVPHLGRKRLDEIADADIARIKTELAKLKPSTRNNVLTTLSMTLKCAVAWNIIDGPPLRVPLLKTANKRPRFYTFEEYESLVAASRLSPEVLAVVLLCGDAGQRDPTLSGC